MPIVSISLNEKILKEVDKLQKDLGFSGRSEIIRAGLRLLLNEEKGKSKLAGVVEGVLIVANQEKYNQDISDIRHEYNDIVKTQIHNHLESHKCLQIFIIKGKAERVRELVTKFQTSRKTDYVKLFVS